VPSGSSDSGKSFEEASTLKRITFEVKRGELVAIVGAVGSGKSSLLLALLGEMEVIHGTWFSVKLHRYKAFRQEKLLHDSRGGLLLQASSCLCTLKFLQMMRMIFLVLRRRNLDVNTSGPDDLIEVVRGHVSNSA